MDGARSSMTYDYARRSETVLGAAGTAYLNQVLKGLGKNADQDLLKSLPVSSLFCSERARHKIKLMESIIGSHT